MSLAAEIRACVRCPLNEKQEPGAHHVPGIAGPEYRPGGIAVVFEAPGYYEARAGTPMAGRVSGLFDDLLAAAGLSRAGLFLTNSVRCQPPNNRIQDYPEAVVACGHWTEQEFGAYAPSVIVLMGRTALRSIFGAEATVAGVRGMLTATPEKHGWGHRVLVATYHPAAASYAGGLNSEPGQFIVHDLMRAKATAEALRIPF